MMFSKQSEITKDKVWIEMTGTEQSRQQRKMNDRKIQIDASQQSILDIVRRKCFILFITTGSPGTTLSGIEL